MTLSTMNNNVSILIQLLASIFTSTLSNKKIEIVSNKYRSLNKNVYASKINSSSMKLP